MATVQLAKNDWQTYFDRFSKKLGDKQVEIEVSSLKLGNQVESRWAPLRGVSYDPKDDVLAIFLEGLEHNIQRPQTIFVEQADGEVNSMEVVEQDDTRQIIRLRNS